MPETTYAAELGRAWAHQRAKRYQQAADEFKAILLSAPTHIDALYGLALAQRGLQQIAEAEATWEQCSALVAQALEQNPGDDRYEMLQRLIEQRLAELRLVAAS